MDVSCTTWREPVEVSRYAAHLGEKYPHIFSSVAAGRCRLVDKSTGGDVAGEHGFGA